MAGRRVGTVPLWYRVYRERVTTVRGLRLGAARLGAVRAGSAPAAPDSLMAPSTARAAPSFTLTGNRVVIGGPPTDVCFSYRFFLRFFFFWCLTREGLYNWT